MEALTGLVQGLGVDALRLDLLAKLALATVLGGAVGWEREVSGKPAGLRTNILICVGATLLTDLSIAFADLTAPSVTASEVVQADPGRIAAQIVSGIGFLGAGTILQARGAVTGLTTAATLWVVAAIGMTVGAGAFVEASGAALLVLVVLVPLGRLENGLEARRKGRTLLVTLRDGPGLVGRTQRTFEERGLTVKVLSVDRDRAAGRLAVCVEVRGPSPAFREAREALLAQDEVEGVRRD